MSNSTNYYKRNNTYIFYPDLEVELLRNSLVGQLIDLKIELRSHRFSDRYWSKELSGIISQLELKFDGVATLLKCRNELSRSCYFAPLPIKLSRKTSLILSNLSCRLREFGAGGK